MVKLYEGFRNDSVVQVAEDKDGAFFARMKGTRQWLSTNDVLVVEEGKVVDYRLTLCNVVEGKKPNLHSSVARKEKVAKALGNGEVQVIFWVDDEWYSRSKEGSKWGAWAKDEHPLAYRSLKKISINICDVSISLGDL